MPQKEHFEPFINGLTYGEHPSLAGEGELISMWNAQFIPTDSSPIIANKLVTKGFVHSSNYGVEGLTSAQFPDLIYLVAITRSSKVWASSISESNFILGAGDSAFTWSDVTPTWCGVYDEETTLSSARYGNFYYLFTGEGTSNMTFTSAGTIRQHGLLDTIVPPGLVTDTGTWPPNDAPGYYEYWITEVVRDTTSGALILESAANPSTGVGTIFVANNTTKVLVTRQASERRNDSATHWRLYRSVRKDTADELAFPHGMLVCELPMVDGNGDSIVRVEDVRSASTTLTAATGQTSNNGLGAWTNQANAVGAPNATYATYTAAIGSLSTGTMTLTFPSSAFTGIVDPIIGIEVVVTCKGTVIGLGKVTVELLFAAGAPNYAPGGPDAPIKSSGWRLTAKTFTLGGEFDDWVPSFTTTGQKKYKLPASLFTAGNFSVKLTVQNDRFLLGSAGIFDLDAVQVKFYYGGSGTLGAEAKKAEGEPYNMLIIASGSEAVAVSRDDPPPIATCGVVFADSLVTDDVSVPGRLRWSEPGFPESFPEPYFYDIPSETNDEITGIYTIGNKLIVGTESTLWRINYLPTASDVRFLRGPMADLIDGKNGMAGPLSASVYTTTDGRPELFYIDGTTARSTDGFATRTVVQKFNLEAFLCGARTRTKKIIVLNDPVSTTMWVSNALGFTVPPRYHTPGLDFGARAGTAANQNCSLMGFNYGALHLDNAGNFKVSGGIASLGHTDIAGDKVVVACGVVLRELDLAKAWGPGNGSVILLGFASQLNTANGAAFGQLLGKVCWLAPYKNFAFDSVPPIFAGEQANSSVIITRPLRLEGPGGEFRILEMYLEPIVEPGNVQIVGKTFNLDATTTTSATFTVLSDTEKIQPKVIIPMFGQAHQFKFKFNYDYGIEIAHPHPHVNLLQGTLIRYDTYGREIRG